MLSRNTRRLGGVAGLVFVALTGLPLLIAPPPPPAGTAAASVLVFYTSHRGSLLFSDWVAALGVVPSLIFLTCIVAIVRGSEGEGGWLWLLSLLGLIGALASVILMTALAAALPFSAPSDDPQVARALSDLLGVSLTVYFFPMVAFFAAVGRVVTTKGGLPAWLGYLAYAVAAVSQVATVGLFVDGGALAPGGPFSLAAFSFQVLWWLAASVVLVVR